MRDLFFSKSVHKLDPKGRVSVPSTFRAALSGSQYNGIIVHPHVESAHFYHGCSFERMERYAGSIDELGPLNDVGHALGVGFMVSATPLPFDSEGRVVLPEHLISGCGLSKKVCFAGLGRTFQIWEPDRFEEEYGKARGELPVHLKHIKLKWTSAPGGDGD